MDFLFDAFIYLFGIGAILLCVFGTFGWFISELNEGQWGAIIITLIFFGIYLLA